MRHRGGVNLVIDPVHYVELSAFTMLSEGNEYKSFGDGADGLSTPRVSARSSWPLWKAEQDGDHIYGVISQRHQCRRKDERLYGAESQGSPAVVARALQRANLDATQLSYIEAHGTGTHWEIPSKSPA